ncbi:hypothetical protein JCM11491_006240 [Sporobolomyces phaffii]
MPPRKASGSGNKEEAENLSKQSLARLNGVTLPAQSLKAAVWYTVTKTELNLPFAASEHFVASLAEVVFQQTLSMGKDLENFAKYKTSSDPRF